MSRDDQGGDGLPPHAQPCEGQLGERQLGEGQLGEETDGLEGIDVGRRDFIKKVIGGAAFAAPVLLSFPMRSAFADPPKRTPDPRPDGTTRRPPAADVAPTPRPIYSNLTTYFDPATTAFAAAASPGFKTSIVYVSYAADVQGSRPILYNQVGVMSPAGRPYFFNMVNIKVGADRISPTGVFVELGAQQLPYGYNSKLGRPYYSNQVYFHTVRER